MLTGFGHGLDCDKQPQARAVLEFEVFTLEFSLLSNMLYDALLVSNIFY